jgi:hypothetical protein
MKIDYDILDETHFDYMANTLLNKYILVINKREYRIIEIEFYLHSDNHPDDYVHRHPDQLSSNMFYFHKFKSGSYKGGTFKGHDLCFGDENTYFGILIRSIYDIANDTVIEGPCNTVNRILSEYNYDSVREFVGDGLGILGNDRGYVLKRNRDLVKKKIYVGSRIGLSDKFPEYQNRKYRYVIYKSRIKKKSNLEEL